MPKLTNTKWASLFNRFQVDTENQDATHAVAAADKKITAVFDFCIISVTGDDASNFLESQLTCDITNLKELAGGYAGFCNPKGRLIATPFVIRFAEGFVLLVPEDLSEEFVTRLSRFILRAKVKVIIDDSQLVVGLINRSMPTDNLTRIAAIVDSPIIQMNDTQHIMLCTPDQIESQWGELESQLSVCDEEVWHLETIRNGHVNICNATKEQFIPQMIQLEKYGGVSFTKGCYPGQEIVARTKYLGSVKRKLHHFSSEAITSAGSAILNEDETKVGVVCVVASTNGPLDYKEGLAVIRTDDTRRAHYTTSDMMPIKNLKPV